MKKWIISVLIGATIVFAIVLISIIICRDTNITGDVTGDGIVSESDLYLAQQHILGAIELTEIEQLRADTNKDGKINIVDLANIQKIILGVE